MAIIKLTRLTYVTINPTKTGRDNQRLERKEIILFNTNEMITAEPNEDGTTTIKYKKAMVDSFQCEETLEEVYDAINNSEN